LGDNYEINVIDIVVLSVSEVWADATITGIVRGSDNSPLADVQVFVVSGIAGAVYIDYTAITDSAGMYTINLPYGFIQHTSASSFGLFNSTFDFENATILLECGSPVSLPYRWNDLGGRALTCGFGCRDETAQPNESVVLTSGDFSINLSDVILETITGGKVFTGVVKDENEQGIATPAVILESNLGSSFRSNYLVPFHKLIDNVTGSLIADKNIFAELYSNNILVGKYQFISNQALFVTAGLENANYEIRLSGNSNFIDSSLISRAASGSGAGVTSSIPVTINNASVELGTILGITDMIFKNSF